MTVVQELFSLLRLVPDQQSFRSADRLLDSIKASASALGVAVAGAFAVDRIYEFTRATLSAVPEIGDLADQTGFAAEEIQRLGFAATQSGSDAETLNGGLRKLVKNIGEARQGSQPMIDALASVGIKLSEVTNDTLKSGATFGQLADGIAKIEDPAKRAAVAQSLLGLSGGKLVPLLSQGAKAIEELGRTVDVLSRGEIDAIGGVDDKLNEVEARFSLAGKRLISAVLPLLDGLADAAIATSKAVSAVGAALVRFAKPLKFVAFVISAVLGVAALQWLGFLAAFVIGQAIAAASTSTLAGTYGLLAGAIDVAAVSLLRFGGRLLATAAPIVAVVGLAVIIALAFEDLYQTLSGGESFFGSFSGKFDDLAAAFFSAGQAGTGFKSALAFLAAGVLFIVSLIDGEFARAFRRIEFIMDFINDPINVAKESLASLRASLVDFLNFVSRNAAKIPGVGGFLSEGFGNIAASVSPSSPPSIAPRAVAGNTNSVSVGAPSVVTNVTINGNATTADAQRIGSAVAQGADAVNRLAVDLVPGVG